MTTKEQKILNVRLYDAVILNNVNEMKELLEQGADPNFKTGYINATIKACDKNNITALKHIVNHQGDVNKKFYSQRWDRYYSGRYRLLWFKNYKFKYDPYDD